jgi:hypothetical protein
MLSVTYKRLILSVFMPNVVMLSVIMLSVLAPGEGIEGTLVRNVTVRGTAS